MPFSFLKTLNPKLFIDFHVISNIDFVQIYQYHTKKIDKETALSAIHRQFAAG